MRLKKMLICDVLYIHTTKSLTKPDYGVIPTGIFPMLEMLREKNYNVKAINLAIELSINPNFDLNIFLSNCKYKVLISDLHWYEHSYSTIELMEISKKINPMVKTVIGGLTSSIFGHEILKDFKSVDYIIKGDGEVGILPIINYIYDGCSGDIERIPNLFYRDNEGDIKFTYSKTNEDLSNLNYVNALEILQNWQTYLKLNVDGIDWFKPVRSFWLGIARGCPFNCAYCGGSKKVLNEVFETQKLRMRDLSVINKELELLKGKFGVLQVKPTHDIGMFNPKYWKQFIDMLNEKQMGIYNEFWQLPSISFIDYFLKNNNNLKISRLALTVISGSEKVRIEQGKNFTNDRFFEVLKLISQYKISLDVYFSPNLPGETKEIFLTETLPFINKIREINPLVNVYLQPITLEPNSILARTLSNIQLRTFKDYYNYCKKENRIEHLGFESEMDSEFFIHTLEIHQKNLRKETETFHYDYSRL